MRKHLKRTQRAYRFPAGRRRITGSDDALSTMLGYVLVGALGAGAASLSPAAGVLAIAAAAAVATAWMRHKARLQLEAVAHYASQRAADDLSGTPPDVRSGTHVSAR